MVLLLLLALLVLSVSALEFPKLLYVFLSMFISDASWRPSFCGEFVHPKSLVRASPRGLIGVRGRV